MPKDIAPIAFKATLQRPTKPANATWSFLVLPTAASAKLPARGQVSVAGTLGGESFKATAEPDGQGSHWLKVSRALREAASANVGDSVAVELAPTDEVVEPPVPAYMRSALAASPAAKAVWNDLKPAGRRDWILWMTSAKKAETRTKRAASACDMLASGKRRVCCFDRSGIYSNSLSAPVAAQ